MYKCPQMSNLVVTDWLSWIMCQNGSQNDCDLVLFT